MTALSQPEQIEASQQPYREVSNRDAGIYEGRFETKRDVLCKIDNHEIPVSFRKLELGGIYSKDTLPSEVKNKILKEGLPIAINVTGFGQFGYEASASEKSFFESARKEFHNKDSTSYGLGYTVSLAEIPPRKLGSTYTADAHIINTALQTEINTHLKTLGFSDDEISKIPCIYNRAYIECYSEGAGVGLELAHRIETAQGKANHDRTERNKLVAHSPTSLFAIPGTDTGGRWYAVGAFAKEVLRIAGQEVPERVNKVDKKGFVPVTDKRTLIHNTQRLIKAVYDPGKKDDVLHEVSDAASGSSDMLKNVIARGLNKETIADLGNQVSKFIQPNIDARNALGKNWDILLLLPEKEATGIDFSKYYADQSEIEALLKPLTSAESRKATSISSLLQKDMMAKAISRIMGITDDELKSIAKDDLDPFLDMMNHLWKDTLKFMKTSQQETPAPSSHMDMLAQTFAGAGAVGVVGSSLLEAMNVKGSIGTALSRLANLSKSQTAITGAEKIQLKDPLPAPRSDTESSHPQENAEIKKLLERLFPNAGSVQMLLFPSQTHVMVEEIPGVLSRIKAAIRDGTSIGELDLPFKIIYAKKDTI